MRYFYALCWFVLVCAGLASIVAYWVNLTRLSLNLSVVVVVVLTALVVGDFLFGSTLNPPPPSV